MPARESKKASNIKTIWQELEFVFHLHPCLNDEELYELMNEALHESDDDSSGGDSTQQRHNRMVDRFETNKRQYFSFVALHEHAELLRFMKRTREGSALLAGFQEHLRQQHKDDNYPFEVMTSENAEEYEIMD